MTRALALALALLALALAAAPARAQEPATGAGDDPAAEAWERQWDPLGDPEYDRKVMKRKGWFFGGALGAIYVFNTTELDGFSLGGAGFSGNGQIGAFAIEDRLSLSFLFHGMTGPRHGDAAFSILSYLGRADLHVFNFSDANHLYLIAGAGRSEIGTFPAQTFGPVKVGGRYETSLIYGVGLTLHRYRYIQLSTEVMGMQVLTGRDQLHVLGLYLTAWFTTDAGLFGE